MKKTILIAMSLATALVAGSAIANDGKRNFNVRADGFQEVPVAIFTTGRATLRLRDQGDHFVYRLRFRNLIGNIENSLGAHIHFGRPGINGGILAFVCGTNILSGPADTPLCISDGQGNGEVRGIISAEDILEVGAQGFPANDIDAFRQAVQAGAAYLNIHTDAFPAGEIRGDFQNIGDDDD